MLKPLALGLALVALATPAMAQSTPSPKPVKKPVAKATAAPSAALKVAAADEYFGRFKMSPLGIANTIRDMGNRVAADQTKTPSIFGGLANVEDAIRDWEHKYPQDPWVPKSLLALEETYLKGAGSEAHDRAVKAATWLRRDYPKDPRAKTAVDDLAKAEAAAAEATP